MALFEHLQVVCCTLISHKLYCLGCICLTCVRLPARRRSWLCSLPCKKRAAQQRRAGQNLTSPGQSAGADENKAYDAIKVAASTVAVLIANVTYVGELQNLYTWHQVSVHWLSTIHIIFDRWWNQDHGSAMPVQLVLASNPR